MTPWDWIQANSWWMNLVGAGTVFLLLVVLLFVFWLNSKPEELACPPLDQAMMDLPDEVVAMFTNQPKSGEQHPRDEIGSNSQTR